MTLHPVSESHVANISIPFSTGNNLVRLISTSLEGSVVVHNAVKVGRAMRCQVALRSL